jgi:hypothetical protein
MLSKLELNIYEFLYKRIGYKITCKIFKKFYDILYWFKYEPRILKLQVNILKNKIIITKLKIQVAIYKMILGV